MIPTNRFNRKLRIRSFRQAYIIFKLMPKMSYKAI